ncbi:MAG: hypothetical protein FWE13_02125 [Firmicutes bacterium]|nr:hypothetical protein [Bacillota bacterium]
MKKHARILSLLVALALSFTLLIGGGIMPVFGLAVGESEIVTQTESRFEIPRDVTYGQTRTLQTGGAHRLVVTAPNGAETVITGASQPFHFVQVGVFRMEFFAEGSERPIYVSNVPVRADGEFTLRVDYNGARIPTVTDINRSFTLPNAVLWYQTEDMDEMEEFSDAEINVRIYGPAFPGGQNFATDASVTLNTIGAYTIVYRATIPGSTTQNFSQTFTVRVQRSINVADMPAPRMTVVGVPTTASLNARVNLPIANATDLYDENVHVEITVTDPDGNSVNQVEVDTRTGFAVRSLADTPVRFDNVWTMYFHPMMVGTYIVSYRAINDFGITSTINTFNIDVQDRTAPTLVYINESAIPSRWGREVARRNPEYQDPNAVPPSRDTAHRDLEGDEMYITVPWPEFIDNGGHFNDQGVWIDNMHATQGVRFEIRDTVNNNVVIRFNNIYDRADTATAGNAFTFNPAIQSQGLYNPGSTATPERVRFWAPLREGETASAERIASGIGAEGGFRFNFAHYVDTAIEHVATLTDWSQFFGNFTFQFQARDERHNITTRTFDVDLQDRFEDTTLPTIDIETTRAMHIPTNLNRVTVPNIIGVDSQATRLNTNFRLAIVNQQGEPTDWIYVRANERLRVVRSTVGTEDRVYLENADYRTIRDNPGPAPLFDRTGTLNITNATELTLIAEATDYVGNVREERETIRLVLGDNFAPELGLALTATAATHRATSEVLNFAGLREGQLERGSNGLINLGGFAVTGVPNDYRNFVGFEMRLTDERGRVVPITQVKSFFINSSAYTGADLEPATRRTYTYGENQGEYMRNPRDNSFVYEGGIGMIVVQDIEVRLTEGEYLLSIRAFDVNGGSVAAALSINIEGREGPGDGNIVVSSASQPIPTVGNINQSYILRHERGFHAPSDIDPARTFMVRRIQNATHFSLMGSEFTAHAPASVIFNEGVFYRRGEGTDVVRGFRPIDAVPYTFVASDSAQVEFSLQGFMPVHARRQFDSTPAARAIDANWVNIPRMIAHNGNHNATVTINVVDPNGSRLTVGTAVTSNLQRREDGSYRFWPGVDGYYTITFTANVGTQSATSDPFRVRIGNLVPVEFTITGGHTGYALNDSFSFNEMIVRSDWNQAIEGNPSINDIRFIKRLIQPGGAVYEINEVGMITRNGEVYRTNRTNTIANQDDGFLLSQTGTYRVEYITIDEQGNEYIIAHEFTINADPIRIPWPVQIFAWVASVLIIAVAIFVIVYIIRFRRRRIKN